MTSTWGETVTVAATCTAVGRTSITMHVEVGVDDRPCCTVDTVHVHTDMGGTPAPIADADRVTLLS